MKKKILESAKILSHARQHFDIQYSLFLVRYSLLILKYKKKWAYFVKK